MQNKCELLLLLLVGRILLLSLWPKKIALSAHSSPEKLLIILQDPTQMSSPLQTFPNTLTHSLAVFISSCALTSVILH